MDISAEHYKSYINRPSYFSVVYHTVQGIVRWLIELFTLTEEDRISAGIYLGNEGHDK